MADGSLEDRDWKDGTYVFSPLITPLRLVWRILDNRSVHYLIMNLKDIQKTSVWPYFFKIFIVTPCPFGTNTSIQHQKVDVTNF